MIAVTIDKREATADELAAFDRADCQDLIGALLARGRKWGLTTVVHESGAPQDAAPATAAIEFALATDDGLTFLRLWLHGEFDVIRKEWPEAPSAVFEGADPLFSGGGK